ncbi:hypothetical protein IL306_002333 [Fusarium sp. DS 682]|nr:hypothetical protein IL306_002333 [Fusarium sp. DS 682]
MAEKKKKLEDKDEARESSLYRAAFWIFIGAKRIQQKIDAAHTFIHDTDVVGKLYIVDIVKDLGGSLQTALASWLNESLLKLEEQLALALGAPDSEEEFKGLDKYIRLASGIQTPVTQVGKFFAEGPWLMGLDEIRDDEKERWIHEMRKKLAHEAIKAEGYKLLIWDYDQSEKDCGNRAGNQWFEVDGKYYCAFLSKGGSTSAFLPSEDYYNKKMPKHGIGLREPYYQNILECGLKSEDSKDVDPGKFVGGYPSCYFQMDLAYIGYCKWRQWADEEKEGVLHCIKNVPNDSN